MNTYFLSTGAHKTPAEGRCAMEWVSYLAGERHTDEPACVSPALAAFCVEFNDDLPDDARQKLRPYLARTIGTRDDGRDGKRAWLATDWLIHTYTPTYLTLAGFNDAAEQLRALPPVLTTESSPDAMLVLGIARHLAFAAGDAAWKSATSAAEFLLRNQVLALARYAHEAGGAGAAQATTWWAGDAWWAGDPRELNAIATRSKAVAWDATRVVAWNAAWAVAKKATRDGLGDAAWFAAKDAARDALEPTVRELQRSAFDLLDRMLPTEALQLPTVPDAALVTAV